MQSIQHLIENATHFLKAKGILHPRREAEDLLAACLNRSRLDLFSNFGQCLEEADVEQYRQWIERRGQKEPFAYIVGTVDFLGLKLRVDRSTLIPRQETELFADRIVQNLPQRCLDVWDVCCGTGCLGLAIKKHYPTSRVKGADLSKEALEVADRNARENGLDVEFLQGDLLRPFLGMRADVVVCNPPYVTFEEYETLEEEVRLFEPKGALVGGVDFYRRLAEELPLFLNPFAKIFLEIGAKQRKGVEEIFSERCWVQKKCEKDWSGWDRFFFLEYREQF